MSNKEQAPGQKFAQAQPVQIHAQYVRDISFENPLAPQALRQGQDRPKTRVDFGMDVRKLKDKGLEDMFEVILTVRAEAHRAEETVFIAEVQYGTTVTLNGISEEHKHPILFIEIPRLAFPFVRQIIHTLVVQGGYPPLLIAPVNFDALYIQRFGQGQIKKMPDQDSIPVSGGKETAKEKKKKKAK